MGYYGSEKQRARRAVATAVSRGRLVRQPCRVCGVSQTEAHHANGYGPGHALDVKWLCTACHDAVHINQYQ